MKQWTDLVCGHVFPVDQGILNRHTESLEAAGFLLPAGECKPFHFAGFNNYYLPTYAADPHHLEERTTDVDVVFR